jgi:MFS transporter, DHA2 family, multidrug resistance protein
MATNASTLPAAKGAAQEVAVPKSDLAATISPGLRAIITLAVMAATLMEVLDTSIVNVALPDMMGNLGATLDQIGWVSTGYIISNVIVLPLTGWLSDYFGRKRYLTYSVILFTVASFGCGTSHTLSELIFWRVLQGAGGAAFLSTAQATMLEIFPPRLQGIGQAMFGVGVIVAPTIGPTVGGLITDRYSWPWIFFINLPIGVVAAVLTMLFVPDSRAAGARRGADFVGIGFLALGLGSLQTVLERGEQDNWFRSGMIVNLAALSLIGICLFIAWELHPANQHPAVNLRVLANRNLAAGAVYGFTLGFSLYGGVFVLPQFLQNLQTHTAEQTGMLLFPGGLATALMMPVVGLLTRRLDARLLMSVGLCLVITSMFQFASRLTLTTADGAIFWPLALRGAGIGLQFVPLSLVALGTLPPRQVAEGTGLFNLFRQLGGSLGIALLATLVDRRLHFHYARLGEHLTLYRPETQQRLAQIQDGLMARGLTADQARAGAYELLNGTLMQQAAVMTYSDVFWLMGCVSLGALLLLLLFHRAQRKAPGAAAA